MFWLVVFILIYALAVFRLDQYYSNRYFWDKGCNRERFGSSVGQPVMELFGNSMVAHGWCFCTYKKHIDIPSSCKLVIECEKPLFRKFNSGLATLFTSAWVDINPLQTCAIIEPVEYTGKWKIFFQTGIGIYQEAKFSHVGQVKIVVDGQGEIYGRDLKGNFVELQIVDRVKAWERTDILMV
jgi:hypothetical protein